MSRARLPPCRTVLSRHPIFMIRDQCDHENQDIHPVEKIRTKQARHTKSPMISVVRQNTDRMMIRVTEVKESIDAKLNFDQLLGTITIVCLKTRGAIANRPSEDLTASCHPGAVPIEVLQLVTQLCTTAVCHQKRFKNTALQRITKHFWRRVGKEVRIL
nr:hypothetical protein BaRGS_024049 [Batillaria attramentaria]